MPTASTTMALRRGLLAGVAVAATGVGVGLAWWARSGKDNVTPNATEENAAAALWGQQFETIDGRILPMASFQGRPLLINFWATWCPPCVEELPLLDQFYRDNAVKGWQVLGIAIDQKVKVEQFLKKMPSLSCGTGWCFRNAMEPDLGESDGISAVQRSFFSEVAAYLS